MPAGDRKGAAVGFACASGRLKFFHSRVDATTDSNPRLSECARLHQAGDRLSGQSESLRKHLIPVRAALTPANSPAASQPWHARFDLKADLDCSAVWSIASRYSVTAHSANTK
jgi:hypothetical protein